MKKKEFITHIDKIVWAETPEARMRAINELYRKTTQQHIEDVCVEMNDFLTQLYADRDGYSRAKIIELVRNKLNSFSNILNK